MIFVSKIGLEKVTCFKIGGQVEIKKHYLTFHKLRKSAEINDFVLFISWKFETA